MPLDRLKPDDPKVNKTLCWQKLHDPIGVPQAKPRLVLHLATRRLPRRQVLQGSNSRRGARGIDTHADPVARLRGQRLRVQPRVGRIPFVPRVHRVVEVVDARLENGIAARCAVDAHPEGGAEPGVSLVFGQRDGPGDEGHGGGRGVDGTRPVAG